MLSSPDARAARASALVWGGSQSVAKPTTIWYSRARAKYLLTFRPQERSNRCVSQITFPASCAWR